MEVGFQAGFLFSCIFLVAIAGPCAGTASLGDFSEGMKRQFEENCRVQCEEPWKTGQETQEPPCLFVWRLAGPCLAACVSDYSLPCPQDWVDMGSGTSIMILHLQLCLGV